jgi:hypothetical protein
MYYSLSRVLNIMRNEMICILAGWLIDGSGAAAQRKMQINLFQVLKI